MQPVIHIKALQIRVWGSRPQLGQPCYEVQVEHQGWEI